MRILSRSVVLLMVLLAGDGRGPGELKSDSQPAPSPQQAALSVTASTAVLQGKPGNSAFSETQKTLPKDVIILRGSPLGAVRFDHKLHSLAQNTKCETCHHPSRKEKPGAALQQACSDCHTKVAIAPMKTKRQAAFHNSTAAAGTCIDCHKAENAKGKATPVKCLGCHKKENI